MSLGSFKTLATAQAIQRQGRGKLVKNIEHVKSSYSLIWHFPGGTEEKHVKSFRICFLDLQNK
jgi:hypothetical protein